MNLKAATLSRENILKSTDKGYLFFLKYFPDLWMHKEFGLSLSFNSPFHATKGTLSVYFHAKKDKWFFKDHHGDGLYGDVFGFVAALHKLNYKRDFKKVLQIILQEMKQYDPPSHTTYKLLNQENGEYISFYK